MKKQVCYECVYLSQLSDSSLTELGDKTQNETRKCTTRQISSYKPLASKCEFLRGLLGNISLNVLLKAEPLQV